MLTDIDGWDDWRAARLERRTAGMEPQEVRELVGPRQIITAEDADDLRTQIGMLFTEWFGRIDDWDDFVGELEQYADVAISRNSAAVRRVKAIVREIGNG